MIGKIDRKEMIRTRWTNVKESPTLQEYGERANRIAFWFAFLLVQEKKSKTRSKMLEHFIKIAMYLSKLHNYQSLMAIFLALNMISGRLAQAWRTLRPKTLSTWKRISTLMSPNDNFSHYRETLKSVELPFIPCQEVILKDLLYHDGSIADFVEEGVWNFKKLQVIGKILDQFRQCQEARYNFTVLNELQNLLLNVPVITSTHLDSVPEEIDANWPLFSVKVNRIVPVYRAEKTEATTESETDDADSSIGNATAPPTTLARSTSTRTRGRSGSVGNDYGLTSGSSIADAARGGSLRNKSSASKISVLNDGSRILPKDRALNFNINVDDNFVPLTERMTVKKSDDMDGYHTLLDRKRNKKKQ